MADNDKQNDVENLDYDNEDIGVSVLFERNHVTGEEELEAEYVEEDETENEDTESDESGEEVEETTPQEEPERNEADKNLEEEEAAKKDAEIIERLKKTEDKYAGTRARLGQYNKALATGIQRELEEGFDVEEVAEKFGVTAKEVQNILNGDDLKIYGSDNPLQAKMNVFQERYTNQKDELDVLFKGEADKYVNAYAAYMRIGGEEAVDDFMGVEKGIVAHVIERGKELTQKYGDDLVKGNFVSVLEAKQTEIAERDAKIEELTALLKTNNSDNGEEAEISRKSTRVPLKASAPKTSSNQKQAKGLGLHFD